VLEAQSIRFNLRQSSAHFEFTIKNDSASASGALIQMGQTFPASMRRLADDAQMPVGPARPQTPKPPFPYSAVEVTIASEADGVTLAGTLVIPERGETYPVVILITGSGPQDRDESIFNHRPFAVIADHLAREGIATLRCDDRGVGGSNGSIATSTTEQLIADVAAMIELVRSRSEINPDRIGLLGHSEGASIVAGAAANNESVAFTILMAGAGMTGAEILKLQMNALLTAAGVPAGARRSPLDAQSELLDAAMRNAGDEELRPLIENLLVLQSGLGVKQNADGFRAMVDAQILNLRTVWFRSFLTHDPQIALRQVKCPTLVLAGGLDLQVPQENVSAIRRALREAGNTEVTVRQFRGLNHLFQTARTGMPDEYQLIEETVNPQVLATITDWIGATVQGNRR